MGRIKYQGHKAFSSIFHCSSQRKMLSELTVLTDHQRTVGNLQRSLHILKSRQEPQYLYCCRDFYLRFMSSLAMFDSTGRLPKQGMLSDTFPVVGPQVLFVNYNWFYLAYSQER